MEELIRLEYKIVEWHLNKGLKLFEDQKEDDKEWTFKTIIESEYKRKQLRILSVVDGKADQIFYADEDDIKQMIQKAKDFFN